TKRPKSEDGSNTGFTRRSRSGCRCARPGCSSKGASGWRSARSTATWPARLTEIVDSSPRYAAMSRGPRTRWSTRTAAAPSRPGHTYEKHAEPPSYDGRLLRNCTLEQLAGFAVEEREAEMGGTLAQAVKDANTVLGIVGGGSGILVHQALPEGAIHQDRQLAGGGRNGFGLAHPVGQAPIEG